MCLLAKIKDKFKLTPKGFTIIEVSISVLIAALIFLLVSGVYVLSQKIYMETDSQAEISQNGRVILDRLTRELRQTPDVVTTLPTSASNTAALPSELQFQDGHNTSTIQYIRYYWNNASGNRQINRQIIVYYFSSQPNIHVHVYDTDPTTHAAPLSAIIEDKVIGDYVDDIEFWGGSLININIYLSKNTQSMILSTAVYGRNL